MPPRTALSNSLRGWRCPHCTLRAFTTTPHHQAFGPEHPRFIDVPEPPQQSLPYRPFIKGRLPIPRNIFPGKEGLSKADDEAIAKSTPQPEKGVQHERGSREEWKVKMSEARRRNLREGLKTLRVRREGDIVREGVRRERDVLERRNLREMPEREDERLTTPSHGLDLTKLLHGPLEDPTREARLRIKTRKHQIHTSAKRAARLDNLHTLYMNARSFIVNTKQLDEAIEEEFDKKDFGNAATGYSAEMGGSRSMWAYGAPVTVQDMLNRANRSGGKFALGGGGGADVGVEVNRERVKRVAERLTGGKMEG